MNNLQKSILQKRKNINELKKKFELLKKNIEYYSSLILKKNTNSNNIIIVDGEMKNERLNTNTSTEIKYEKEKIRNKLNYSKFALKNRKIDIFQNLSRFARAFIDKGSVYIANLQDFFFI